MASVWDQVTGQDDGDFYRETFGGKSGQSAKTARKASKVAPETTYSGGVDMGDNEELNKYLMAGRKRGEELTGISSEDIGKKRGEIRTRYENILEGPSRGAARVADARNANIKSLGASQAKSGVSGGIADAQKMSMNQGYSAKMGDVRQKEYVDALNKLEKQYRGGAKDIMTAEGQYGALGVGEAPAPSAPDGGTSFICSRLKEKGLMSKKESLLMTRFMLSVAFESAIFLYWYFSNMKKVVDNMDLSLSEWKDIKKNTVTTVLKFVKLGAIQDARNRYIHECGQVARLGGLEMPKIVYNNSLRLCIPYFLLIFTKVQTWKWLAGFFKLKMKRYKTKHFRSCHG